MSKRQQLVLFPNANNGSVGTAVFLRSLLKLKILCILLSLFVQFVNGSSSLQHNFLGSSSQNILDNINLFDKIYISYHHCVWNNDNTDCSSSDNEINVQDDIVDTSTSSYWYMGKLSSCYKPSVAYTLYGTTTTNDTNNPCRKETYINSYYTTSDGLFDFINSIEASGNVEFTNQQIQSNDGNIITSSQCIVDSTDGSNDYQIKNVYHNEKIHVSSISYGLGCSSPSIFRPRKKQQFVYNTYSGQYCDPNDTIETANTLDELNNELDTKIQCLVLYDKSSSSNAQEDQNNDNSNSPLDILENSRICSVRESGSQCPDPYRFKTHHSYQYQKVRVIVSYMLLGCGILFTLISLYMMKIRYGNDSKLFGSSVGDDNDTTTGSSISNGSNQSQSKNDTIMNRGCWGLLGRKQQKQQQEQQPKPPRHLERRKQQYKERRSSSITRKNRSVVTKPPLDSIEIDTIPVTNHDTSIKKTNSNIIEILFGNSNDEKSNNTKIDQQQQSYHQKAVQNNNNNDDEEYPTLVSNLTETNTMMLMNLDDNNPNHQTTTTTTATTATTSTKDTKRLQAYVVAKERSTNFLKKVFQRKEERQQQQQNNNQFNTTTATTTTASAAVAL